MRCTTSGGTKRKASYEARETVELCSQQEIGPEESAGVQQETYFKELLWDMIVESSITWDEARDLIKDDPRFAAVARNGDRKQWFSEWKNQKAKSERLEAKEQKAINKLDDLGMSTFMRLLFDKNATPASTTWKVARKRIKKDPRFHALATEQEKAQAFSEMSPTIWRVLERQATC